MASKTTTVSPAGAIGAGCSATCDSYYSGIKPPSYQGAETIAYTNYQVVATGVGNWRPKRIKVTHAYTYSDGTTGGQTITYRSRDYGDTNPWSFPAIKESSNWENPFEFRETDPGTETRLRTVNDTITGVEVEFEESTPPTPTSYTITTAVTPAGSGTATGGGTFNSGASCTLTATPASGYSFVRWEKNGAQVSTSASHTFTVSESATYTAIFESATPLVHITVTAFKNAGRVALNGIPGDATLPSPWTTVSADIPLGDSVTITATPTDPNVHPFKAWYLDPSAPGDPEHSGTLVPGAGATYTFIASANATYFATFEGGGTVVVSTTPSEAQPEAKVSINGQTDNTYKYSLDVPTGSTVTVSASERGGPQPFPYSSMYYFEGWIDNDPDSPTYGTTLSTDRVYTFQLAVKQGYSGPYSYANLLAQYTEFEQIETEVVPDVAMGSISASPPPKDGKWFPLWTMVTFTATPSPHYRFVKWTKFYPTGYEYDYSTNNQITFEAGTQWPGVVYRAYFEWDGTDLLVNSFNRSTPVQLVYDPATNLLVADY